MEGTSLQNGRFTLISRLGEDGGMGEVWLAFMHMCGAPKLHATNCVRRSFSSYSIGVSPPSAECGRSVL